MDSTQVAVYKNGLRIQAADIFVSIEPMLNEDFLKVSWQTLADFVRWNKENPLVRHAVKMYPDLIPRAYFLLTLKYNAFGYVPTKYALTKDFIGMLGDDLIETELELMEYAKTKKEIFPGLSRIMPVIREVYDAEHFRLDVLPPTPHQAYAVFVLNHSEKILKGVSPEELFGILAVIDSRLQKLFSVIANTDGIKDKK